MASLATKLEKTIVEDGDESTKEAKIPPTAETKEENVTPSPKQIKSKGTRNQAIAKIYEDSTLNGQEKEKRIQEIMKGDTVVALETSSQPEGNKTVPQSKQIQPIYKDDNLKKQEQQQQSLSGPKIGKSIEGITKGDMAVTADASSHPEGNKTAHRNKQIQSIYTDSNLTNQEKQLQIKALVGDGSIPEATRTSTDISSSISVTSLIAERNKAVRAVYKDLSLTALEKQKQIQAIMAETSQHSLASADSNTIERNKAIQMVYKDTSLSAKDKQNRIQAIMKASSSTNDAPPPVPTDGTQAVQKRKLIAAVYKDTSLSAKDKQKRILAIMNDAPPPVPSDGAQAVQKRKLIAAVYKDGTLSGQEKKHRVQEIVFRLAHSSGPSYQGPAPITPQRTQGAFNPPASWTPPKGDEGAQQRIQIAAIYRDKNLSASDKQKRVKLVMVGEIVIVEKSLPVLPPLLSPPQSVEESVPPTVAAVPHQVGEESAAAKRRAIAAIYKDNSLSGGEKEKLIQTIMKSGDIPDQYYVEAPRAAASPQTILPISGAAHTSVQNDPTAAKRRAIAAIYKDGSLTGPDRHKVIQSIMKSGEIPDKYYVPPPAPTPGLEQDSIMEDMKPPAVISITSPTFEPVEGTIPQSTEIALVLESTREDTGSIKRRAIAAIYKDNKLSGPEKQRKIADVMKAGLIPPEYQAIVERKKKKKKSAQIMVPNMEDDLASLISMGTLQATDEVDTIRDICKDTGISASEKYKRIQSLVEKAVSQHDPGTKRHKRSAQVTTITTASRSEGNAAPEDPAVIRRRAIQSIYRDTSLSAQEKHRRVQELMRGAPAPNQYAATAPPPVLAPPPAPYPRSTPVAAASNMPSRSNPRRRNSDNESSSCSEESFSDEPSGSDSRSGSRSSYSSRSSRSRSSNSGSYSRSSYSGSSRSRGSSGSGSSYSSSSYSGSSRSLIDAEVTPFNPNNMQNFPTSVPVYTGNKPIGSHIDEDSDSEYEERGNPRRRLFCFIMLSILIIGGVCGPLLNKYWDEVSTWFDEIISGTKAPQPTFMPSMAPSLYPSSIPSSIPTDYLQFRIPSPAACQRIATGEELDNEAEYVDNTAPKGFDIKMDVVVQSTAQLDITKAEDIDPIVDELELKMQQILAPELSECPEDFQVATSSVRGTGGRRRLVTRFIIRNTKIEAWHQIKESCLDNGINCLRVLTRLNLILGDSEATLKLVNRISVLFGANDLVQKLKLSELTYNTIEVVGVAASSGSEAPLSSPSGIPSQSPSIVPTSSV
jgi:uncharacterized membrane protein YgcG